MSFGSGDSDVIYRASEWQQRFHDTRVFEVLGAGSQGPGKTTALLMDPMDIVRCEHERCLDKKHPHRLRWGESRAWVLHLRRTRPSLNKTISDSQLTYPRIDPDVKWDSEQTTWIFKSGLRIQFGHCKDPDSWHQYESNEFVAVYYDELTEFLEEQYERINLRVRSSDPVLKSKLPNGRFRYLRIRSASNPAIVRDQSGDSSFLIRDPNWVRRRFVDAHPEGNVVFRKTTDLGNGKKTILERLYMPATIDDNPDKEFVENQKTKLLNARPHLRKALLYGDWYVTLSSHFADEWDARIHVITPFRIPPEWRRFRSMDWGYKVPGHIIWWAMDEEGNLYATHEFGFKKMLAPQVAARVKMIEQRLGLWDKRSDKSRITGPADNQIFREDGRGGRTIAETFEDGGVPWVKAAQGAGSRAGNAVLVAERLADHENRTTTPGLVFFSTCKNTVKTIPSIQTDPDDSEAPMEGGDDHPYDCTAYGVAFASRGLAGIPAMRPLGGERSRWDEIEEQEDREERRRALGDSGSANHYLDEYA